MYTKSLLILSLAASVGLAGNALAVTKNNPVEHAEGKIEKQVEKSTAVKKQVKQYDKNKQAKYKDGDSKKAKYNKEKYGKEKQTKSKDQLKKAEYRQAKDKDGRVKSAAAGSDKSKEMRARSKDGKAIKEGVKASGEKVQGKKPWWKFWGE
ncbi:MAG: hypothetical protein RIC89_10410 [Pseudomonadales bacterium]